MNSAHEPQISAASTRAALNHIIAVTSVRTSVRRVRVLRACAYRRSDIVRTSEWHTMCSICDSSDTAGSKQTQQIKNIICNRNWFAMLLYIRVHWHRAGIPPLRPFISVRPESVRQTQQKANTALTTQYLLLHHSAWRSNVPHAGTRHDRTGADEETRRRDSSIHQRKWCSVPDLRRGDRITLSLTILVSIVCRVRLCAVCLLSRVRLHPHFTCCYIISVLVLRRL